MVCDVEPNQLVALFHLLHTRSVSAAASKLGVTQPTVSRILGQLRLQVGDPLLVRRGNTMVRTSRGDELAGRLSEWMMLTEAMMQQGEFNPAQLQRRVRIGSTDFGVLSVIGPTMRALRFRAPGLALDVTPLRKDLSAALAIGESDLAVSGLEHDPARLHSQLLFTDTFSCLVRSAHPLVDGASGPVSLDAFLSFDHIGLTVSDAELDRVSLTLQERAASRRVAINLPYFSVAPEILAGTDMLMTIPTRAARHYAVQYGLTAIPAPAQLGQMDYYLLWHERSHRDPAVTWLRSEMLSVMRGHTPEE
ncbi:LysR family transcriptional regulator [Altericroceibacterium xinjiangense]|uniref:LysR family transcriptional regulator n=1 Tax=Altericroceibacterium xinjiangense TaxID=762261 RepID=UPI000F7E3FC8|nr:LysR family transcriptional regulator [Altericroceibacterium xinjiangense]